MDKSKTTIRKKIAFICGLIATVIGGMATLMSSFYLLPYLSVDPSKVSMAIAPALLWLLLGLYLIKLSKAAPKQ